MEVDCKLSYWSRSLLYSICAKVSYMESATCSMFSLTYLWFYSFKMYFDLEKAVWSNYRRPVDGSVQGYLFNRACLLQSLSLRFHGVPTLSSSLYSQLLSLPPPFFPYIHPYPSSLLHPSCPGDSSWHWLKDLSRLPLNAGRDVYHGSATLLSPFSDGLKRNARAGVCPCLYFKVWRLRDRNEAALLLFSPVLYISILESSIWA